MKSYDKAKIAYDAYCRASGGRSLITGDALPVFELLKAEVQEAWYWAADAVVKSCKGGSY